MRLLTAELRGWLPPLNGQRWVTDPIVYARFYHPLSSWEWYVYEFDGDDLFFGWVVGHEKEYGYVSLRELEEVNVLGWKVRRDTKFKPTKLSRIKEKYADRP